MYSSGMHSIVIQMIEMHLVAELGDLFQLPMHMI